MQAQQQHPAAVDGPISLITPLGKLLRSNPPLRLSLESRAHLAGSCCFYSSSLSKQTAKYVTKLTDLSAGYSQSSCGYCKSKPKRTRQALSTSHKSQPIVTIVNSVAVCH